MTDSSSRRSSPNRSTSDHEMPESSSRRQEKRLKSNRVLHQSEEYRFEFISGPTGEIQVGERMEISVALKKCSTNEIVTSGGLSRAEVELVTINKEFNKNNNLYDWEEEKFTKQIIHYPSGSIVSSSRFHLTEGVGNYNGASMYRNSGNKWMRLAVRLVSVPTETTEPMLVSKIRVREGILKDPIVVRGCGKANKKKKNETKEIQATEDHSSHGTNDGTNTTNNIGGHGHEQMPQNRSTQRMDEETNTTNHNGLTMTMVPSEMTCRRSTKDLLNLLPPGFRFQAIQHRKSFVKAAALRPSVTSEVVARVTICTNHMQRKKQVSVVGTELKCLLGQFLTIQQVPVVKIDYHFDSADITFTDANDRQKLMQKNRCSWIGYIFSLEEHNEDANGEPATFGAECWIMLLDFPICHMSEPRIKNAIAPFGTLLEWRRDPLNGQRIILKAGVVNLQSVPEFIFLTEHIGNRYTFWSMQCEILEEGGHDLEPPAPSAGSVPIDNLCGFSVEDVMNWLGQPGPAGPSQQNMQQNLNMGDSVSDWQSSCYGVELTNRWNLLHQHISTRFMAEHSGSPRIPAMKEIMQARPKRGVLIEPLDSTDDSDEEPPLKRNLHCKYRLRFVNKVRKYSGTLEPVKADDGDDLKVALFDENNMRITSGPQSSASVVVSALQGDFNAGGEDYWTSDEFSRCEEAGLQVQEGDCILQLADGEACLSGAVFHRIGKFRIGVMMASSPLHDERILEAISEPVLIYKKSMPSSKLRSILMAVLFSVKLLWKTKAAHLKLLELMDKKTVQVEDERIPEEMSGPFFVMGDHGKDQAIEDMIRMFAVHGFPAKFVDDEYFRSFVRRINPGFKMPSPRFIREAVRKFESDISDNFAESSPDANQPIREDQISETLMSDHPGCESSAVDGKDGADSGALDEATSDQFARQSDSKVNNQRRRSAVWNHFTVVTGICDNRRTAICEICKKAFRADSRNGTAHLMRHIQWCSTRKEFEAARKSRLLSPEPPCLPSGLGAIPEENK